MPASMPLRGAVLRVGEKKQVESVVALSEVPYSPQTALLVRLTFKESWDADNNPTTSCCEKTFRMVAEGFDTALVILAAMVFEKAHTQDAEYRPSPLYIN